MRINLFFFLVFHTFSFAGFSQKSTPQKTRFIDESIQEFFIGETVYPQKKNEFQFTIMPSYWKNTESKFLFIPFQFEYGFTDRFQAEIVVPYYFNYPKAGQKESNFSNTEIEFLYNVLKRDRPFMLSLAFGVGLPIIKEVKGINESGIEWEPAIIAAKQIGKIQVHASLVGEFTQTESIVNYNLSTIVPIGSWRFTVELNKRTNDKKIFYLSPGLIWKGLDDLEFGIGVSNSITKGTSDRGVMLMITYEFSGRQGRDKD